MKGITPKLTLVGSHWVEADNIGNGWFCNSPLQDSFFMPDDDKAIWVEWNTRRMAQSARVEVTPDEKLPYWRREWSYSLRREEGVVWDSVEEILNRVFPKAETDKAYTIYIRVLYE